MRDREFCWAQGPSRLTCPTIWQIVSVLLPSLNVVRLAGNAAFSKAYCDHGSTLERFLGEQEKSVLSRTRKTLTPVIERLKLWREANHLSQSQAVEILQSAGLPAKLKTLQAWESGRNSPQPITAAALERFLDERSG
jgi:DNA-binding transcriptional regulator YiaG